MGTGTVVYLGDAFTCTGTGTFTMELHTCSWRAADVWCDSNAKEYRYLVPVPGR